MEGQYANDLPHAPAFTAPPLSFPGLKGHAEDESVRAALDRSGLQKDRVGQGFARI